MTHRWIENFFQAVRKLDPKISKLLLARPKLELNWEGTAVKDHLTASDWKSLNEEITEQYDKRNDRGVAVSYASMVEDRLSWLVETRFVEGLSKQEKRRILSTSGPLGSFSARTEVSYAFGVIPKSVCEELRLIGQIRNKFAHRARRVRFSDPEISALCRKLSNTTVDGHEREYDPLQHYALSCLLTMAILFGIGQVWSHRSASVTDESPE